MPGLHSLPDLSHPNFDLRRDEEIVYDSAATMEALSQSLASMSTIRTYAEAAVEATTAANDNKENQDPAQE